MKSRPAKAARLRRAGLSIFVALVFVAILSPLARAADERPNVLIFVADDLGWADPGFRGGPIDTPALDSLARDGIEFERFYTTPTCSPTRAALHTGRDPMRLGVAYNTIMAWHNNGVHPDERFMPEAFREAGYQTAMVGKWHLGHAQQTYHPNSRGYAPRDWASYPIPVESLRDEPAPGMAPPALRRVLDWQHGEQGRILYDCEPYPLVGGGICK
jgi:arylsulfatase A-like enzyme